MYSPVDLHIHSRYSDGTRTPAELVEMASLQGFKAIALSDHDSISGIDEAIVAGSRLKIEIIPSVELSVEVRNYHDVHILGYYINHNDTGFQARLDNFRSWRDQRGQEIIGRINDKLASQGKGGITYQEVLAGSDGALGRPHIARVLMSKGYVASMEEAFDNYLVSCNVPKQYFPLEEAISEIHRIGGLAVLAHPTSISRDRTLLREIIGGLTSQGLDGLEAYNTLASLDESEFLLSIARRHQLTITGGSDFHGNEGEDCLGIEGNRFPIDYRLVEGLKERLTRNKKGSAEPFPA